MPWIADPPAAISAALRRSAAFKLDRKFAKAACSASTLTYFLDHSRLKFSHMYFCLTASSEKSLALETATAAAKTATWNFIL